MAVVGIGEILVQPSMKDFQRDVGKEVAGLEGSAPVKKAGGKFGAALKGAAVAGIAGGAVAIGTALTRGFGRLKSIEQAQATLTGLGHSAQNVEKIMGNANAAVKGTAFGLGDAATAAASLVAAGIKPGQDLEKTLTLVGDAATIAGVEFNDMSAIFGKAAAGNKVQMDIIGQLHDAGVPALQLIATEMGVTAEEASKMASKGEVDFATFERAMTQGMGGAAQESGKTLSGAFDNSMAAVGRFGANLIQDIYPQLTEFFNGFIEWMGPVEEIGKVIGEKLGTALKNMTTWVRENKDMISSFLPVLGIAVGGLAAYFAITKTMAAFKAIQTWYAATTLSQKGLNAAMKANPIGLIITAITLLVGAIVWLYQNNETARKIIDAAWTGIKNAVKFAWERVIKPAFDAISNFVKNVLGPAFKWLKDKVIDPVWNGIKSVIDSVWKNGIKPVFTAIMQVLKGDFTGAFQTAKDAIDRIWKGVANVVRKPINFVINTVYNKGIVPVFNKVASLVGISEIDPADEIPEFAKGGLAKKGWALVGEEGPELVNFSNPGRVYTAAETRAMLAGNSQAPDGALDALHAAGVDTRSHAGIGGWVDSAFGGLRNAAAAVGGALKKGLDWVRGGLAKAAEWVLNPIKNSLDAALGTTGFGGMAGGLAKKAIDGAINWLRGKDSEAADDGGALFYDGALGRFAKPANGHITSGFGASRGKWPHAGIDFAVPIGSAVRSMLNGVVRKIGWNAASGRTGKGMIVDHAQGYSSYYGHLNGWGKRPGEEVKAGERIADSGNTGRSTGPHLHAELWNGGKPFNFMSYLYDSGGVVPTGLRMIANASNKPEALLSNSQWKNMSTLANQAAQNMGGGTDADAMRYALHGMEIKMQTESGTVFAKLVNKGVNDLTRGKKSILS